LSNKVGLGEAGKTSLLNAISKKSEHDSPDITDGINIKEWEINLPDKTTLTFSMWDFGKSV
jgi:GTPase SAR1 family protein